MTGAAGSPNAGLHAPTADTDGRTDVYLAPPKNKPGMTGVIVYRDSGPYQSSYIFLMPDPPKDGVPLPRRARVLPRDPGRLRVRLRGSAL